MGEWVLQGVDRFGYLGMAMALLVEGMAIPFPGDVVLAFYGFLVSLDRFALLPSIMVTALSAALGSLFPYLLGYHGVRFLKRNTQSSSVASVFRVSPWLVLIPGRFIPGLRTASSYIAGMQRITVSRFFTLSLTGFTLWCGFWITVGHLFGSRWKTIVANVDHFFYWMGAAVLVYLVYRIVRAAANR
jgi:membrane protein DedA with SNARE-associated domain